MLVGVVAAVVIFVWAGLVSPEAGLQCEYYFTIVSWCELAAQLHAVRRWYSMRHPLPNPAAFAELLRVLAAVHSSLFPSRSPAHVRSASYSI